MYVPEKWLRKWIEDTARRELAGLDREIGLLKKLVAARDGEIVCLEAQVASAQGATVLA